jgi:exo-beta-1,3-glucanase (GH17 family)
MPAKRLFPALILTLCALLSILYWWRQSQPAILVDALSDRLSCVSYAPYRKPHQSPFDKSQHIPAAQIDAELKRLSRRFDCVRIYSVSRGLQAVPRLAQRHGLKVLLGIWIGRDPRYNERELTRGIDLVRKYPSAIRAIIVGNEVLLRGEQPASALRTFIERVKTAVPGVPVTYADVWEFWLRNKELADVVSFVTVHILPYWEDRPVDIDNAVGHVSHIYQHVKNELKGKEVMIGETGWPSYGRQRQGAMPSLVNQARFIREFAVRAELEKIPYNVIEAFDQPWKRQQEGAVGGYWGLYDQSETPKFPFRGPVAEVPGRTWAVFGVMATFFAVFMMRWRKPSGLEILMRLIISTAAGGACLNLWRDMAMANRNGVEWSVTGLYLFLFIAVTFLVGAPLAAWCAKGEAPPAVAPVSHLFRWIRRNDHSYDGAARGLCVLRFAFLFGAALVCLLLVFDSRYRDFPLALYSVPTVGFALLSWVNGKSGADLEEILLAGWVGIAALWIAVSEHLITPRGEPWRLAEGVNQHALAWVGLCLLLSCSVLAPVVLELRAKHLVKHE